MSLGIGHGVARSSLTRRRRARRGVGRVVRRSRIAWKEMMKWASGSVGGEE